MERKKTNSFVAYKCKYTALNIYNIIDKYTCSLFLHIYDSFYSVIIDNLLFVQIKYIHVLIDLHQIFITHSLQAQKCKIIYIYITVHIYI